MEPQKRINAALGANDPIEIPRTTDPVRSTTSFQPQPHPFPTPSHTHSTPPAPPTSSQPLSLMKDGHVWLVRVRGDTPYHGGQPILPHPNPTHTATQPYPIPLLPNPTPTQNPHVKGGCLSVMDSQGQKELTRHQKRSACTILDGLTSTFDLSEYMGG